MARILVVDDEAGIRSFLSAALEGEGHEVSEAADVAGALEQIGRGSFPLVITDLRMPGADGMDLVRRLRSEQPEVQVIVITAHGSVDAAVEAMKLGAFDFLQKPLSGPAELRLLAARALERHQLQARQEIATTSREPQLSYGCAPMESVVHALRKVASTDATVLLQGESGTGKEVAARSLHAWSPRRERPFVAVNCAALAETLLESELFGHERGAFTGASERRRGRIELAAGGTLFLDEVGELKPAMQAKLLRVLQERCFERVGGSQTVSCDVRWVAATNRDLTEMMLTGDFREDLYHRLAVFPVTLPPLCQRPDDLLPLADALLGRIGAELGRPTVTLSEEARRALVEHDWPGNIRELANALERALIMADSAIEVTDLSLGPRRRQPEATVSAAIAELPTMEEAERDAIRQALEHYDGNRRRAAEHLGIGLRTLYDKLKKHGLG